MLRYNVNTDVVHSHLLTTFSRNVPVKWKKPNALKHSVKTYYVPNDRHLLTPGHCDSALVAFFILYANVCCDKRVKNDATWLSLCIALEHNTVSIMQRDSCIYFRTSTMALAEINV